MGEEKTFLQLAKEIGISKQNVYRCFKRLPDEVRQEAVHRDNVIYLPESVQSLIKAEFVVTDASNEAHHDVLQEAVGSTSTETTASMGLNGSNELNGAGFATVIQVLREQLAEKDRQIENLQTALAQEQAALAREQENVKLAQESVRLAQQLHGADKVQQALSVSSNGAVDGKAAHDETVEEVAPDGTVETDGTDGKRHRGFRWPWSRRD